MNIYIYIFVSVVFLSFALLDPILTQVLVFMGSRDRMQNPHLRAGMANCLSYLLPCPSLTPNNEGSFYRENLFKIHPHRKEVQYIIKQYFNLRN
jgi:hypothetical protein